MPQVHDPNRVPAHRARVATLIAIPLIFLIAVLAVYLTMAIDPGSRPVPPSGERSGPVTPGGSSKDLPAGSPRVQP